MFYVNKNNNKDVIELLYSDNDMVVIITQEAVIKGEITGKVIKINKKELKKKYKKAPNRLIKIKPLNKYQKEELLGKIITDKEGIINYTEDYIYEKEMIERIEFHNNQSSKEREQMLIELAD